MQVRDLFPLGWAVWTHLVSSEAPPGEQDMLGTLLSLKYHILEKIERMKDCVSESLGMIEAHWMPQRWAEMYNRDTWKSTEDWQKSDDLQSYSLVSHRRIPTPNASSLIAFLSSEKGQHVGGLLHTNTIRYGSTRLLSKFAQCCKERLLICPSLPASLQPKSPHGNCIN